MKCFEPMLPQSISIAWITFNTQTFLIALATMTLCVAAWLPARDWRVPANAVVIAAFALLAGRAGFVALNWSYFSEHTNEIASLAGISEHAAIVGGTIGYWLLARRKQPITNSQWAGVFALLLAGIAASIGCISNGCAYGREVFWQTDGAGSLAWLLRVDWPDATLTRNPRWPAQALLAGWLALGIITALLTWLRGSKRVAAIIMPVALLWFAAGDFIVQFVRGDGAWMLGTLRVFQWFDVMLAGFSILLLLRQILRKP